MLRALVDGLTRHHALNYRLTNWIPRRLAGRFMGWFSTIEQPLVAGLSIRAFQWFAGDLALHEARHQQFRSLRDCFTRELRPEARTVDATPGVIVSPCDGMVVACGAIRETTLIQAKGHTYTLEELLGDPRLVAEHRNGSYVTLRLSATMYHRFHSPYDAEITSVRVIAGDAWNVNPATLARVPRVYCRNTRAVIPMRASSTGTRLTLVPVGAVLVSSIRLSFVPDNALAAGVVSCHAVLAKGQEMGHFQHGSTIVALAAPGLVLSEQVSEGARLRVGQGLWREPGALA